MNLNYDLFIDFEICKLNQLKFLDKSENEKINIRSYYNKMGTESVMSTNRSITFISPLRSLFHHLTFISNLICYTDVVKTLWPSG